MVSLDFELNQDGCSRLYDALSCLAKINESLTIEARVDQLNLSVLNSSKSAYVAFTLDRRTFFSSYEFIPDERQRNDRFAFQILNKALSSVFKGKLNDTRNPEAALEKCVVGIHDKGRDTAWRLVVKMVHRNGVTKTHKFTFEAVEAMHALFDSTRATNRWRVSGRLLREYIEFFGARTEQLDMFCEDNRFTFTSYTEKIMNGKDVLKQPLQTAVSIDTQDFEEFDAIDNLHIAISVSDFKNMVMHAASLNTDVTAVYSVPARPLQFSYGVPGIHCEFTLTTIGGERGAAAAPAPNPAAARNLGRQPDRESRASSVTNGPASFRGERSSQQAMPPPSVPASRLTALRGSRLGSNHLGSQRSAVIEQDQDSLFLPADEEDRRWNPVEEQEEDRDMLGWASAQDDGLFQDTFRDTSSATRLSRPGTATTLRAAEAFIAPTQRAADVRGLFDD